MSEEPRDLVERTFRFAETVRRFINRLPSTPSNWADGKQVIRSSGSVAANYLEAQEGLSRKDFFYRIKISRKEARESGLWLRLLQIDEADPLHTERQQLVVEAEALKRILSAIAAKDDTAG